MREIPWTVVRGFFMGSADIVPGVSGGTVALVFGVYQRLITAIRAGSKALGRFVRFDGAAGAAWLARVEWLFLVPLVAGIGLAVLLLAGPLEALLRERPIEMSALFLGLVAGSVVVAWKLLRTRDALRMSILLATGGVVFASLGLRGGTSEDSVGQLDEAALWAFFLAGGLAICAMILPGISGSFILVLLGMYGPVLAAVNDRDLGTVAVFLVGAVIGLALFSQLLYWALAEHYDSVMAALIGLMLGSLRVLWPWPNGVGSTAIGAPDEAVAVSVAIALIAFVTVIAIDVFARRSERATAPIQ